VNAPVWRVEDDGETLLPVAATAEAGLVSLPFLVTAVRRRWRRVALVAGLCALLALGLPRVMGQQHTASTTLLLISSPTTDANDAAAMNLGLLHTRTVAQGVVDDLHLPLTADAFAGTISASVLSDQLMSVSVQAPTSQEAIRRVTALAAVYLAFRSQKLGASATSSIQANQQHIDNLRSQVAALTKRYNAAASHASQAELASTLLTQRAQLEAEINDAEQQNAETEVANQAIVGASHVVDPAALVVKSRLKREVLTVMSGLIGGAGLGLAMVLAPAVLSTRLRRRDDVARALGLPVRFSSGPVRGRRGSILGGTHRRNAEQLAHGLATALPEAAGPARLTVASIGDVRDAAYALGALADELAGDGTAVAVVDLTAAGAIATRSRLPFGQRDPVRRRQLVRVHRQQVRVSQLAARRRDGLSGAKELHQAEVVLTLIELDLGAGVDVLGDLAEVCVVVVSAGSASAERLRSSSTLLRQCDIRPAFAMLVGADATDDSSGLVSARRSS
jgi:capsular polysaccharide biosynthesis protein